MNFTGNKRDIQQFIYRLDNDVIYDIKIDKHRKPKTLDQNKKAWAVMNEIGNLLKISKEEVYLSMLRAYGQREYVLLLSKANPDDFFKYYDEESTIQNKGKEFKSYIVYRGISTYDTKEMAIFIDGLLMEAEQLDVQIIEYKELKEEMLKNE